MRKQYCLEIVLQKISYAHGAFPAPGDGDALVGANFAET
jgi:hypothetical protein